MVLHLPIKLLFIIAFLSAVSVGLALGDVPYLETPHFLWRSMLPNTPIPQALLDALPNQVRIAGNEDGNMKYDGQIPLSQKVDELGYEPPSPRSFLERDSATSIFVLEKDLIVGAKLNIHFTQCSRDTCPPFPSYKMSQTMPSFSSTSLPQLLHFFDISPTSKAALIMNQTLARCEHPNPINGKVQFCATTLAKMVTSVTQNLRESQNIKAVSVDGVQTDALLQYRITSVSKIAEGRSLIACHRLGFPHGVYYCHQPHGAAVFSVPLVRASDGAKLNAYAMCHYFTSKWSPEYVAFTVLGVKPGNTVCHFFQPDNVIFYRN